MVQWNPDDIAWAAGLLEGEGYFSRQPNRGQWHRYEVGCGMTDEDVVRKLRLVFGIGKVTHQARPNGHKTLWRWAVRKNPEVYAICAAVHAFMGERRCRRIEHLLLAINHERSLQELHEWRQQAGRRVGALRKKAP